MKSHSNQPNMSKMFQKQFESTGRTYIKNENPETAPLKMSTKTQQWRNSYDTNEIKSILQAQPVPPPLNKKLLDQIEKTYPVKKNGIMLDHAFQTHNMETFFDKSVQQRRAFGENEQRKMRYAIETSSPKVLEKE